MSLCNRWCISTTYETVVRHFLSFFLGILYCLLLFQDGVQLVPFSDVIKMGNKSNASAISPKGDDTAIIMYTSGSTGVPKGVILSHKNIISTLKAFCDAVQIYPDDVFLGFLPLAHVFELLAESVCLLNGVPIGYSSPLTLIDSSSKIQRGSKGDASVLHPTCLTAVPVSVFSNLSLSSFFLLRFFTWKENCSITKQLSSA